MNVVCSICAESSVASALREQGVSIYLFFFLISKTGGVNFGEEFYGESESEKKNLKK